MLVEWVKTQCLSLYNPSKNKIILDTSLHIHLDHIVTVMITYSCFTHLKYPLDKEKSYKSQRTAMLN